MKNPDTLATLGAQNTEGRQTKQKTQHNTKNLKIATKTPKENKTRMNPSSRRVGSFCYL
jgi:hypothetical protein